LAKPLNRPHPTNWGDEGKERAAMAESKSPIICGTCQRNLPEDLKEEDAPKYFAQENIFPRSDEDDAFSNEATRILSFIESVAYVTRYATEEVEHEHYETILDLLFQLSEEAKRRLELADYAMREKWNRDHGHNAPMRKGGRV
jgi:hypothetical protein